MGLPSVHTEGFVMNLKGKVAVVTGGNTGIRKSCVLALAAEGATFIIDYVANPDATEQVESQGGRASVVESVPPGLTAVDVQDNSRYE